MITAGIWFTPRRLVVALVNSEGKETGVSFSTARGERGCVDLVMCLKARDVSDLVTTDEVARSNPIAPPAARHGLRMWLAPAGVVDGVRRIAGLAQKPPKQSATLLARWKTVASMSTYLRLLVGPVDDRQLPLWTRARPLGIATPAK